MFIITRNEVLLKSEEPMNRALHRPISGSSTWGWDPSPALPNRFSELMGPNMARVFLSFFFSFPMCSNSWPVYRRLTTWEMVFWLYIVIGLPRAQHTVRLSCLIRPVSFSLVSAVLCEACCTQCLHLDIIYCLLEESLLKWSISFTSGSSKMSVPRPVPWNEHAASHTRTWARAAGALRGLWFVTEWRAYRL